MDKELLRVVIIAFGLIIIVGMLAWHFYKNKTSFQDMLFFGNQESPGKTDPTMDASHENDDAIPKPRKKLINAEELLAKIKAKTQAKPKVVAKAAEKPKPKRPEPIFDEDELSDQMFADMEDDENFDFGDDNLFAKESHTPEASQNHDDTEDEDYFLADEPEEVTEMPRFIAPEVIQFRVLAKSPEGFNGLDLLKAFRIAQLEYCNLNIFERYDTNHLVDFCVISMAGDGTFPDHGLDSFHTPGLVFMMQPGVVDDAVKVFDDFLEAINIVAVDMDGSLLDHEKKPLTNATIKLIRQSL